jgi:hypothetical protein
MTRLIDPNSAIDFMLKTAPEYAQAKAERVYIESFLKSKKAILMQNHGDKALGAQEREAYADKEYIGLLAALRVAVEKEETLKWKLEAARTRVDVWRSTEASNRAIDKAAA